MKLRLALFISLLVCSFHGRAQIAYPEVNGTPLDEVLRSIEKNHQVSFSFNQDIIETFLISFPEGKYALQSLLDIIISQSPITIKYIDETSIALIPIDVSSKTFCGTIADNSNREPLPYATISNPSGKGVTSDNQGGFKYTPMPTDQYIEVSYLGYEKQRIYLTEKNLSTCDTLYLKLQSNLLNTVVLTEYLDDGISISEDLNHLVFQPEKSASLPGISDMDVMAGLQFLPGITNPNESSSGVFIRGGTPDQNLVLWDDIPIYYTSHIFGSIGSFNPFIIDEVNIYRNGVSSRYGGRVSGVIDIKSRSEKPDRIEGSLGVNMTQIHGEIAVPIGSRSSFFLSVRSSTTQNWNSPALQSYTEKIFQGTKVEEVDFNELENFIRFSDAALKWNYKTQKNKFELSLIASLNDLEFTTQIPNINAFSVDDLDLEHSGVKLSWERRWSKNLYSEFIASSTEFSNVYGLNFQTIRNPEESPISARFNNLLREGNTRLGFIWDASETKQFRFGIQGTTDNINLSIVNRNFDEMSENTESFRNRLVATYVDYHMEVPRLLYLDVGLRYQFSAELKNSYFAPRIKLSTPLTENLDLKLSTSKNFQFVSQLLVFDTNDIGIENQIWVTANNVSVPVIESNQWTGGLIYRKGKWTIDVDAYVKELTGLTSLSDSFDPSVEVPFSTGTARIRGVDFLVKKRFSSNFKTWLSYSFSRSNYEFLALSTEPFPATYDQRHILQWVNMFKKGRTEYSLGLTIKSGLPFSEGTGIQNGRVTYDQINGQRLNSYMRLDASIIYRLKETASYKSFISISLQNIFDKTNRLGRQFIPIIDREAGERDIEIIDFLGLGFTPNMSINYEF